MHEAMPRSEGHPFLRNVAVAAVAGALLLMGCTRGGTDQKPHDLLSGTWEYMPGTEVGDHSLAIHHTGLAVLDLNEPGRPPKNPHYEPNPPVNLYGSHLEVTDNDKVGVKAKIKNLEGIATLSLLESPPTRHDEHVDHAAGLSVAVSNEKATLNLWDGQQNDPSKSLSLKTKASHDAATIAIEQHDDSTTVLVNDAKVTLDKKLLGDEVWFGFDASQKWNLTKLESHGAKIVDTSKSDADTSADGLYGVMQDSGNDDKYIGTAVDPTMLFANPEYEQLVAKNFNEIEPEMAGKFQALEPEEGQFEFNELDGLVNWAEKNGKQVHGHTLAFTEAYPKWLFDKLQDPNTTADEARSLLDNFVSTVVTRYDGKHGHGKINAWDVDNEVFDPQNWGALNQQSIWYQKLGPSYISEALKAAHKANPDAELYINEWGMETDSTRREAMLSLIKDLKSQGITANVGFQAHFDKDTLNDDQAMSPIFDGAMVDYMNEFNALGSKVRISEASVANAGDNTTQSDTYEALAEACMRAENCVGVNMWGATNSSYKNRYPYFTGDNSDQDPGDDAPTTQNKDGKITYRPAWEGLKNGLSYNDN